MVSTLKVTKIQTPNSDSDVISLDASTGNITVPKPVTFSGTVTGTAMVKLLDADITNVAEYIINSTYINSTYDNYRLYARFLPATDNAQLISRLYVDTDINGSGSLPGGNIYGYENAAMSSSTYNNNNTSSYGVVGVANMGNATGEGIGLIFDFMNVNHFSPSGGVIYQAYHYNNSGLHGATNGAVAMGVPSTYYNHYIRGIQLLFGSGNIANGNIKLYGLG